MREKLDEFFDRSEQEVIEGVFEVWEGDHDIAQGFWDFLRNMDDERRLLWIMQTLAKNAGKKIEFTIFRKQALLSLATDESFADVLEEMYLI